ncbi:sensor histidine kinase [Actinoplanes sp. NPDC049548]|uniref:sensor histidine kinase n=1 Tax=Actinoplanes sp. NPDC049548 TaxID=3155152 RepID=UPI00342F2344
MLVDTTVLGTVSDRWRTRLDERLRLLPYLALAASTVMVALAGDDSQMPHQPLPVSLAAAAATAVWLLLWRRRRTHLAVFFTGIVALDALLIWTNALYGFFAWTGFLFVQHALHGRWRLLGAAAVGVCTGVSQVRGAWVPAQWGTIAVVLALNVAIGTAMTYLAIVTQGHHARRADLVRELEEANAKLAAALAENADLHTRLLVQAREAGVLDERQRLAGEIHDVLAQGLTGIVTQLEAAGQASGRPADHERHLATAKQLARDSLAEARRSVQALRPRPLDAGSLPQALAEVVEGWSARHGIGVEMITTGTVQPLLPEIDATLLRTAQEALANVARHAGARRVALTLSYLEDLVTLDVRDDGSGFDPASPPARPEGGYGLTAMRERVRRIAGTLEVESEPGAGTAVSACVPAIPLGVAA